MVILLCLGYYAVNAQVSDTRLKSMDNKTVSSSDIFRNEGKPIVISFWATWCKPCIKELEAISEVYDEWIEETGVKLVAVSIDDSRSAAKVPSLVAGKDWPFEVFIDSNEEFKRAVNVTSVPFTIILNGLGEIVWRHAGYAPGGEEEVIEEVKKLIK